MQTYLSRYLNTLFKWFQDHKNTINTSKSIVITFYRALHPQLQPDTIHLQLSGQRIHSSEAIRYLGINFIQSRFLKDEIHSSVNDPSSLISSEHPIPTALKTYYIYAHKTLIRPVIDFRHLILIAVKKTDMERIIKTERVSLRKIRQFPRHHHPTSSSSFNNNTSLNLFCALSKRFTIRVTF